MLDPALLERGVRRLRLGLPPAGERRRPPRPRASAPRSRAEHDRHLDRARGDARGRRRRGSPSRRPARSTASPRCSRRRRTRRSRSRPRCTRASKLAGEGLIARLRARLRLHRASSSASCRSSASATRTGTSSTSTARSSATRRGCACSATAGRRSRTSTCRTASSAMLTAAEAHDGRAGSTHVYNLGTDETVIVDDSVAMITRTSASHPAIEHTGGRRGWVGDSPADPSRLLADPRARLGADADDRARRSSGRSTGSRRNPYAVAEKR